MRRWVPLIALALMHTIVDTSALLVSPLWSRLTDECKLAGATLVIVFLSQQLPTSLSQGVFGYLRDRRRLTWLVWLAPLVAVICLTLMGPVAGPTRVGWLCLLFLVGGVAVGAFHPEAAVTAGSLLPGNRTRGLSIFMLGGSFGLALGPFLSGEVVHAWGLEGLIYVLPGLVILIPVLLIGTRVGSPDAGKPVAHGPQLGIVEMFDGRIGLAVCVLLACSLRLVPNMAMAKVLSYTLDQREFDVRMIGRVQSLFLASASVGMFLMAVLFPAGWERRFMIVAPLMGLPLLALLGWEGCPNWLFLATLVPTGLVLWGTTPAMVSYAQQMFPRGTGLASAITMGLAWGGGGLIEVGFTAHFQEIKHPQWALWTFLPFVAAGALGAWLLPQVAIADGPGDGQMLRRDS